MINLSCFLSTSSSTLCVHKCTIQIRIHFVALLPCLEEAARIEQCKEGFLLCKMSQVARFQTCRIAILPTKMNSLYLQPMVWIWDVLSNKEVVDIVASAPTQATAARAIVDSAIRAWRLKFPTSKIDDCAAICLFFGPPSANSSKENEPSSQMKACSLSSKEQLRMKLFRDLSKFNHLYFLVLMRSFQYVRILNQNRPLLLADRQKALRIAYRTRKKKSGLL
ncbi:hypothetical protein HPP92_015218 [Vanilla planifolia]|uniref:protein-serine/threonine phosphatase n=1 Tax=Vanilla planifolia TaxID=51239 RepID=A0A835QVH0_VANPL|nr:hypothetical protein HPP92_015218 [Vanilla planifolia]